MLIWRKLADPVARGKALLRAVEATVGLAKDLALLPGLIVAPAVGLASLPEASPTWGASAALPSGNWVDMALVYRVAGTVGICN